MTIITLEIAEELATALTRQSEASKTSVQALSAAVLEQWLLDQTVTVQEPWSVEDIAAIEDGLAQSLAGDTISQHEAHARLLAKLT
jgi:predicted transcriptional regulator